MQLLARVLVLLCLLGASPLPGSLNGGFPASFSTLSAGGTVTTQIGSSITASGAVCDGTTDDTSAINTYLAGLANGGIVYVAQGRMCLINSANLNVPDNVVLVGAASPQSVTRAYTLSGTTGFILNPSYTISMGKGAQLRDLVVLASGMTANPTAAQVISAVAAWGTSNSVGITIPPNTGGIVLNDVFVLGFNTAVKALSGQFSITRLAGDDYNGIEVAHAGDNATMDDIRFEPYYALNTNPSTGSWARPGVAFNFHDGNTLGGGALTRAFSFMYASAVKLDATGIMGIHNSNFEWQKSWGNGVTGTVGIRMLAWCAGCFIDTTAVSGYDTGISDEVGNTVSFTGILVVGGTQTGMLLAGGSATPTVIMVGGRPATGNTISVTLTSASVTGSPVTVTYTAVAGDTTGSVAEHLSQIINSTQSLIAARISAATSGSTTTVHWPANITATATSASTGWITQSTASGSVHPGSNGTISSAQFTSVPTPAIIIGNTVRGANAWIISAPNLSNGTVPLPSGWLQWNSPSGGSIHDLVLSGIQWSKWTASEGLGPISSCGTTPSIAGPNYDDGGTIIEGTSATGCTITFVTPFPTAPTVTITNWSGNASQVALSVVSATGFTVANASASGNKFTYSVKP